MVALPTNNRDQRVHSKQVLIVAPSGLVAQNSRMDDRSVRIAGNRVLVGVPTGCRLCRNLE